MPTVILHHKSAYQLYTTVADGPCYERALTLKEVKRIIRRENGESGMRALPARLERAHRKGTSSMIHESLEDEISLNRAGPNETHMRLPDFIARYLTHNAAVQPQIRAQREFVGWNCLLGSTRSYGHSALGKGL